MARYTLKRLLQMIPLLLLVSLISFGLIKLVPGDPAVVMGGSNATPAEIEVIRRNLGLDQPLWQQLLSFYANLARGDLGRSLLLGQPVMEALVERTPVTLWISLYSLILTVVVGLVTGIVAALRHNTWVDQAVSILALIGVSLPNFWLGLMMIVLFSVWLGWLPTGGYVAPSTSLVGFLQTATMPALSLALLQIGLLTRITRSTMLDVLGQDYIRTARAKGLPETVVVLKHALANVMIPVVTVIGLILSVLLSGSVIIETIFSVPGIGSLLGNAILRRDYPMIQGGLLFVAAALMLLNIVVDVLYGVFDPRVRVDGRG
ncbi:ABC transporter permease [uncultured Alsobacter sp.]|uniref:ABC transporter permease n=1 Tax=uncultured Alsobacter sp. TaxID=1748258 RepID=UPI0026010239|nr:ABC transporter permease [uncultured Alsobacter sp.]